MSCKTILVHLKAARLVPQLLAPTIVLAERFNAHVIGITALPPVYVLPAGTPGFGDTIVVDEYRKAYAEEAERIRRSFVEASTGRPFVIEWRLEDAEQGSLTSGVAKRILEHARSADLVIAGQDDPDWSGTYHHNISEALVLESGRPVLLVPNGPPAARVGRCVLVAWSGTRESARAAFDALPLLAGADRVHVVSIEHSPGLTTATEDLAAALIAHGVRCTGAERRHTSADPGSAILAAVRDHGCDLLVMGCYGHSRLRELVLGGATRHVLEQMPVAVLLSH
jgi:nucleotide-binding universal stress UspA family protein